MTESTAITQKENRNTPPLLLLARANWGWQSGLLIFGIVMGVVLESSPVSSNSGLNSRG